MNGNLIVIVLILAFVGYLFYTGRTKLAKSIILSLVIEAEKNLGTGTGIYKKQWVIGQVYSNLPSIVKFFLTEQELDYLVESAVETLKEMLKEKPLIVNLDKE